VGSGYIQQVVRRYGLTPPQPVLSPHICLGQKRAVLTLLLATYENPVMLNHEIISRIVTFMEAGRVPSPEIRLADVQLGVWY